MQQRRTLLLGILGMAATWLGAILPARGATPPPSGANGPIDLRDMLTKGLKARRPVEFRYLNVVADMVDTGDLPVSLVHSTFFWARQRYERPLQYFQQALHVRAKRIGVEVPGMNSALSTTRPTPPTPGFTVP